MRCFNGTTDTTTVMRSTAYWSLTLARRYDEQGLPRPTRSSSAPHELADVQRHILADRRLRASTWP